MTVWETLVDQTKQIIPVAAGTALDAYGKKLAGSPVSAEHSKTVESKKRNWIIIGVIAAVVIGVGIWFFKRK